MPPIIRSSISASDPLAARARIALRDVLLPGLFLLAIGLVLLRTDWSGRHNLVAVLEDREPAARPATPHSLQELASYPRRFGAFFADHFGFRREMVDARGRLVIGLLKKSPSPKVVVGRGDWLFYTGDRSLENRLHQIPLSAASLDQWATRIEQRKRWLAARGIRYLFVVAPDKQSIYPEYLPRSLIPPPAKRGSIN